MGFEVEPTRVTSRHLRWSAVPVVVATIAIAGIAFAAKPAPGVPAAPALAAPVATPTSRASASGVTSLVADPTPRPTSVPLGPLVDERPALPATSHSPASAPSDFATPVDPEASHRPLPSRLRCTSLERAVCARVAAAAIGALPPTWPAVRAASVWASLLCDNSLQCPPRLLRSVVPLGSAVLDLADGGPPIWVNVVGWRTLTGSSSGLQLEAWIVRS